MNEINKTNLSEQAKFRLNQIIGIENHFHPENNQRKSYSKKLSKFVTTFDKILIVLRATCDWLKVLNICNIKKLYFFCECMYEMDSFALFTANAWRKNDVEAIEYSVKIRINQGHLEEKLDIANISDRTQYYSDEFKKMRCEIQE